MYAASALVGAGVAPLFMTLGFFIWGSEWLGSAHALNLFKCSLAGCMFAATGLLLNGPGLSLLLQRETLSPLLLSSLLGIVVGDNAWLAALQILGARRVILIDCLKPTLSAVLATVLLHEPLPARLFFGSVLVCAGVAAVCRERQSDDDHDPDHGHAAAGYALAALNVTLDVFGSVLTKQSGAPLSTWEINAGRVGFALPCIDVQKEAAESYRVALCSLVLGPVTRKCKIGVLLFCVDGHHIACKLAVGVEEAVGELSTG